MDNGWIKIHRKILNNPIWTSGDSHLFHLWCYILLKVNHKEKKILFNGKELTIKVGEGVFGLNQIVKDLTNVKKETTPKFKKFKTIYYRRLKILENLGNVKLQPTNKFTIIKVLNWGRYQGTETQLKLQRNSTETQVKTNKNGKNGKNVKKGGKAPNPLINEFLSYLKEKAEIIDTPTKYQRTDSWILIRKMKSLAKEKKGAEPTNEEIMNGLKYLVDSAYQDKFHSRKVGNIRYLYNNIGAIVKSSKNNSSVVI